MTAAYRIKVIEKGSRHSVAWLIPSEGTMKEAPKEYIEDLKGRNPSAHDRFMAQIESYCDGNMLTGKRWKPITYGKTRMYEFKDNASQSRLIGTTISYSHNNITESLFVIVVGFGGKKENKIDEVHLKIAKERCNLLKTMAKQSDFHKLVEVEK